MNLPSSLLQNGRLFHTTISPNHRQNCVQVRANMSPEMNHKKWFFILQVLNSDNAVKHTPSEFRLQV